MTKERPALSAATLTLLKHVRQSMSEDEWLDLCVVTCRVGAEWPSARSKAIFGSYDGYLKSAEWMEKRSAVLQRAVNVCEYPGCGDNAQDVHHLGYGVEWGDEPLSFLVALCRHHHALAHDDAGQYTGKQAMLRDLG